MAPDGAAHGAAELSVDDNPDHITDKVVHAIITDPVMSSVYKLLLRLPWRLLA